MPATVLLALLLRTGAHAADFEIRSPVIDPGEFEFDAKLGHGLDRRAARSGDRGAVAEFEYGVNDWWSPAVEGEWNREAGSEQPTRFETLTVENRFQLAEPGRYCADPGLFLEYDRGVPRGAPDAVRFGPLLRKELGPTVTLVNLLAQKELGSRARRSLGGFLAWQTRLAWRPELEPGFEVYAGRTDAGPGGANQARAGPVLFGVFRLSQRQDIRYEIGWLFGLDRQTPDHTFKLLIGYEYQF
jgi:hypothetical protein